MSRLTALARRSGLTTRVSRINSRAYGSKTDQTAQTDRGIEKQRKFAPRRGRKLTTPYSELTSGPDHRGRAGEPAP